MSARTMASGHRSTRPSTPAVWLAAIRPATLTAAIGPVAVGTALAAADGKQQLGAAAAALVGAVLIQCGTNLFNDYADFEKGADTEERLGPARATQRGWLNPRQVMLGAALSFALATVAGMYLVAVAGMPVVWIGVASITAGVLYTGGPAPLAYRGLGDVFVLLFFGGVAVCGSYYVQALTLHPRVVLASLALGLLATAILVVNNLRDRATDATAGKRTLVVRFGQRFGRWEYALLLAGAYAVPVGWWLWLAMASAAHAGVLLPLCSAPLAVATLRRVWTLDGAALNPELGATARIGLLFAALLSVGVLL